MTVLDPMYDLNNFIVPQESKLPPEDKEKWVTALRSGHYAQGKKRLRLLSDTYCCLGVYLDIKDPQGWRLDTLEDSVSGKCYMHRLSDYSTALEKENFPGFFVNTSGDDIHGLLATANDHGATFEQIADWIEKNL